MPYNPQQWKDGNAGGTPLTADRLNFMENGIDVAHDIADAATSVLDTKAPLTRAMPAGGTAGQLLVKSSAADYATQWQTPSTTVANHTHSESDVNGLVDDLSAIRTALFGGPTRTKPPHAQVTLSADVTGLAAATDYIASTGYTKTVDSDTMVYLGTSASDPTEITAPVSGRYIVDIRQESNATSGLFYVSVLYNQTKANAASTRITNQSMFRYAVGGTGEGSHNQGAFVVNLNQGDRVGWAIYSSVAFTLRAAFFGLTTTRVIVRYLGPPA